MLNRSSVPNSYCCLTYAGQGPYILSPSCWRCQGSFCVLQDIYALLGNATTSTKVAVPYGGPFRLAYWLTNNARQPTANSWAAFISSFDGSSAPIGLDFLRNSSAFPRTYREIPFSLPGGTTSFNLTFEGTRVWFFLDW